MKFFNSNLKTLVVIFVLTLSNCNSVFAQNNALQFDGTNDQVNISDSPSLGFSITSKFSIEAWFNTTASGYRIIVSKRYDASPYRGYELILSNGQVDFSINSTYPSNYVKVVTTNTFNDGNWHHVAAVYNGIPNGNNIYIYVDGVLQATTIPANTLSGVITSTDLVTIASRQGVLAYNFMGTIDEVRIWNKALCVQEINAKKNCNLTGNEYGLVAYYNFNQGVAAANNATVTSLNDLSPSANTGTLSGFALTGPTSNWIASTASVTGNCSPYGPIAVSGNTALCSGVTFSTVLTGSGALTYTWSTGPNTASISVSPTVNTTYSLIGTDVNSCVTSKTVAVSINPLPTVTANTSTNVLCSGQSATLSAGGASTYTWSTNSNLSAIVVSPTTTTTYTLNGTSPVGCTNSVSITQSVAICTGIQANSIMNEIDLTVFPNPGNGSLTLRSEINLTLKLVNELGMTIETIHLNESNNRTEHITALSSGVYFVLSEGDMTGIKRKIVVCN